MTDRSDPGNAVSMAMGANRPIYRGVYKVRIVLEMIKFEHTVFALPFAYSGAWLASNGMPSFYHFFWITVAMIGARSTAMALNRLIDKEIDSMNPRTMTRALPQKQVTDAFVWCFTALAFALFLTAAWVLGPLCLCLAPVATFIVTVYSYTKRFTWLCHLWLGVALAVAPSASWLAVKGSLAPVPILLSGAVALWSAGFDIIYACLDVDFDRNNGIYSIPARFGVAKALRISKIFYITSFYLMLIVGAIASRGPVYFSAIAVIAALLAYQHMVVGPGRLERVNLAFGTLNGFVSVAFLLGILMDFGIWK